MSEQQAQKRGLRSEAQKTATARTGYDPVPPANPVAGAFGKQQKQGQSDPDLASAKLASKLASKEETRGKKKDADTPGE